MSIHTRFRAGTIAFLVLGFSGWTQPPRPTMPDAPGATAGPGARLRPLPGLPDAPPLRGLRQYHRAQVNPQALLKRLEGFEQGAFRLDLGGAYAWDLVLERSAVRSPGYIVRHITSQGIRTVAPTPDRSFRGHVRGKPGSKVRLSFQDGRIHGFVDGGDAGRVFLEPMDHFQPGSPREAHAVYLEKDAVPESGAACGLSAPGQGSMPMPLPNGLSGIQAPTPPNPSALSGLHRITAPGMLAKPSADASGEAAASGEAGAEPCALVEIAVGADYSMVKGMGTAAAVEKRINDIYNMVDGLYQDERINIHVRISEIVIETEAKYTWGSAVDINKYLTSLTSWMTGPNGFKKPFDVGSMWYYQLGGGTVGLAWVGVVCNNNRSNVIRYFTATSRSMMIDAAHELGHNFNAPHISNPDWVMNPSITGYNDKWDATTVGTIVGHKKTRSCLSACNVAPIAAFTVTGPSACAETRTFTDFSGGDPTAWLWEFGDGSSSREKSPVHTYVVPGRYNAKLSASNAFGVGTLTRSNIRVKYFPVPVVKGADGCPPAALTLEAQGTGTMRWYDSSAGGSPIAMGPTFTTPVLTRARTYYVEDGEADLPSTKVGPLSWTIGPGQNFTANGDRRLFFEVGRPAALVSAKVNAGSAGPRIVEILDTKDRRIAVRTVQVPAGESRVSLGFNLEPGDYALKVVGSGDSVNLFRNASGADYPYVSPDTLITITGSDATAQDSVTQAGYYYFFYDWEVRETGCSSVRVPVTAKFTCTSDLADASAPPFSAILRPMAPGRYRLEGHAPRAGTLEITLRSLDGSLLRRFSNPVPAGPLGASINLQGLPATLLLVDIRMGDFRLQKFLPRF